LGSGSQPYKMFGVQGSKSNKNLADLELGINFLVKKNEITSKKIYHVTTLLIRCHLSCTSSLDTPKKAKVNTHTKNHQNTFISFFQKSHEKKHFCWISKFSTIIFFIYRTLHIRCHKCRRFRITLTLNFFRLVARKTSLLIRPTPHANHHVPFF